MISLLKAALMPHALLLLRFAAQPCGAFVPSPDRRPTSSKPRGATATDDEVVTANNNDAPISTPTANHDYASYSAVEIKEAQAVAEARARANFDAFAMNALFVDVDERPEPTPCRISRGSSSEALPPDLPPGCLLRIGPNGASTDEGFLDGDGLVHAITLSPPDDEGERQIMYSATYVDTNGRKLERKAGNDGKKFGGTLGAAPYGLPMLANLLRNGLTFRTLSPQKDTCNTSLAVSGSRVLALMEQCPPSEIKVGKRGGVRTVESFARLDGAVPPGPITGGSFGAHGRTEPRTGERVHVSYQSNSRPYVRVDTFAEDWQLVSSIGVDTPCPVMVHDLALTRSYAVILDFPLTIRPRRFLSNQFPVEYEPQNGARIGLTPRGVGRERDDATTRWFDVENGVVLHAANAYERDEDGRVIVHAFKSVPDGSSSYILDYTPAYLHEWVLDPHTGETVSERCLNPDVLVEFPNCEDGAAGARTACAYGLVTTGIGGPLVQFSTPDTAVLLDGVVSLALEDDAVPGCAKGDVVGRFDLPHGWHFVSEPTVVTKMGGDGRYVLLIATFVPPADDDKGNHVAVARDGTSLTSQLLILDGENLKDGAVAAIDLPSHVNYGLHSEFLRWDILE